MRGSLSEIRWANSAQDVSAYLRVGGSRRITAAIMLTKAAHRLIDRAPFPDFFERRDSVPAVASAQTSGIKASLRLD
jgi:hypothetical protein